MGMIKKETQSHIKEHSEAKLDLFKNYLWRYLVILLNDKYTKQINIFDVFCGMGIHKDGKKGSPIIAMDIIEDNLKKHPNKTIRLIINDLQKERVKAVKDYIDKHYKNICEVIAYNLDATEMMDIVKAEINSSKNTKNFVFIDPYGYKNIYKKDIAAIMETGKSEIMLFLPTSIMYRFSKVALIDEENKSYAHLKRFIKDFFDDKNHPMPQEGYEQLDYIAFIKEAMSFDDKYYSASYHIQRDSKDFYALFFITKHILGLQKFLEIKWELDKKCGKGFKKKSEVGLFDELNFEDEQKACFKKLEDSLRYFLKDFRNNNEIYEFTLKCGFLPKHTNALLTQFGKNEEVIFDRDVRKNSFYLDYEYFRNNDEKYRVKLK